MIFVFFLDGGRRHLGFQKFSVFIGYRGPRDRDASSRQISSKSVNPLRRCRDFLDFRNSQILLAEVAWRAEMHHNAKFCQNP